MYCISYLQSLHNWIVQLNSLFVFSLSFSLLHFGLNKCSRPYPYTQLSLLQIFNVSGRKKFDNLPIPFIRHSHLYRTPQSWLLLGLLEKVLLFDSFKYNKHIWSFFSAWNDHQPDTPAELFRESVSVIHVTKHVSIQLYRQSYINT